MRISVIIPTKNRASDLVKAVVSIVAQTRRPDELILVDQSASDSSSVCMESLARGIPVIILGSPHDLTYNPVPASIPPGRWRLCYSADELLAAIRFYQGRDSGAIARHQQEGTKIRDTFFTPVTAESVRRFLQLSPQI